MSTEPVAVCLSTEQRQYDITDVRVMEKRSVLTSCCPQSYSPTVTPVGQKWHCTTNSNKLGERTGACWDSPRVSRSLRSLFSLTPVY